MPLHFSSRGTSPPLLEEDMAKRVGQYFYGSGMERREYWENIERKIIADIKNENTENFDINNTDESGVSLLYIACQTGMSDLCRVLLENNVNINITDIYGRTPLMAASYYGYAKIVDILLQHGANLTHIDTYGSTEVFKLFQGKTWLFELFQNTFLGCMTPLALAASTGQTKIGRYVISQKPDFINIPVSKSGMVPLMLALCGGHKDMVDILVEKKVNLHPKSNYELSCVGYAKALSLPLFKLNIPLITMEGEEWDLSPRKRRKQPLTPNVYMSPTKKIYSPKECLNWIKISLKPKRSRSLNHRRNEKNVVDEDDNALKSIFQLSKMEQYWPLFKEQEISFKTFLTMDDEDLSAIGISKLCVRQKLLILIDHYKKIFYSK